MERLDGYHGIWFTLGQFRPSGDELSPYGDKYSGGLGTYTAKHCPLAIYDDVVEKTFFVYGGARDHRRHLLAMVGAYDHRRHRVCRPLVVHDKATVDDPHDNPSIAQDEDGYLWIFVSGRGRHRPGFIYRSCSPRCVEDGFEVVSEGELTYPQPWWIQGAGFLHLFTKYTGVRELYWNRSHDGVTWTPDQKLAGMEGHYQVSRRVPEAGVSGLGDLIGGAGQPEQSRVITAFNRHPEGHPDNRTDLFYLETDDLGDSWRTAGGQDLSAELPLTTAQTPARVYDFASDQRLVYMKDISVDRDGHPVILVVTSADHRPGPMGGPRKWTLARWQPEGWQLTEITSTTHNYDMGSVYITADDWRIVAPTEPGPQHWGTGGEMALWVSEDDGWSWRMADQLTSGSISNHAYARRPVNAHPGFYAFWADGNPDHFSASRLYFCNREGTVWQMPIAMSGQEAEPEVVEPGG